MKSLLRLAVLLSLIFLSTSRSISSQERAHDLGIAIESKAKQGKNLENSIGTTLIVAAGSLPFTVFYTDFVFDLYRFIDKGFDVQYAPWPLKNQYSVALSSGEKFIRVGVAIGIAAAIGLLSITIPYH